MSKQRLLSGHEIVPLTHEEQKEIEDTGVRFPSQMVRLQPDGWLLPNVMAHKYCEKIYNFKVSQVYLSIGVTMYFFEM